MKKTSFFQRQLVFWLLATIVFVLGGFAISFHIMHNNEERRHLHPIVFLRNMVESISQVTSPENAMKIISQSRGPFARSRIALLNESGGEVFSNVAPSELKTPLPMSLAQLPPKVGDIVLLNGGSSTSFSPAIVKLDTHPVRYLLFVPEPHNIPIPEFPMLMIFVVAASMLSGLLSFAVLFYYLKKNALVLEGVMQEIHNGNLKARVPVKKFDEVGQFMTKFNAMADEIEELVARIQQQEKSRLNILQEIGHDFRTPLASLSNVLETLDTRVENLSIEQKREMTSMSLGEVKYLSSLVDDLLFLANVEDPKYLKEGAIVSCEKLIEDEAYSFQISQTNSQKKLIIRKELPEAFTFFGDPHLIKRMLRNLLDNAAAYAKSEVKLSVYLGAKSIVFKVEDDGPGLSEERIKSYGTKRPSRALIQKKENRISLGLGSVIVKAVVHAHQGKLHVENIGAVSAPASGARIIIEFPLRD